MFAAPGPPPGPPPSKVTTDDSMKPTSADTGPSAAPNTSSMPNEPIKKVDPIASAIPEDPREMEKLLSREKMAFFQELEMDRVLTAFKLNPYDILECPMEADEKTITKIYRRKSLLIHPDKVKDPRAETAFSLLKQASIVLLDEDKRKNLDETVMAARVLCLKELGLPSSTAADDERLLHLIPSFDERVRKGTKEIMIDDELRKRRAIRIQHAAEGEAERKKEEAAAERKRKAEESEVWEKTRDTRINDWRSFQKGGKKKKKGSENGINTLG